MIRHQMRIRSNVNINIHICYFLHIFFNLVLISQFFKFSILFRFDTLLNSFLHFVMQFFMMTGRLVEEICIACALVNFDVF